MSDFWLYLKLGFDHVLDWNAYDHVLFLIVLVVGYTFDNWKRMLLLVTLFTIGHTLSLLLAAYDIVSVNSRLVEFLIPITIFATGLFNVFTAKNAFKSGKMGIQYVATVFFGLIHGLGFSIYFSHINGGAKIVSLLEFALGIEFAQLMIVFIVLFVSFLVQTFFRFSKRDWILVISSIVIGIVIPMLIANKIW